MVNPLEAFIRNRLKTKPILLCSHAVMGYPSFETNHEAVAAFVNAGVDIMELQFPFSDPIADGPVLMEANQSAVAAGTTINDCFLHAQKITSLHSDTAFLVMTYYNIVYVRGIDKFAEDCAESGICGVIIPDLPIEEADCWLAACKRSNLAAVFLVTPETDSERLKTIANLSSGFVYCVARKGITGSKTSFDQTFCDYVNRVKAVSDIPIGVGFGVRSSEDIQALLDSQCVAIAIVCSRAIQLMNDGGVAMAAEFLQSLQKSSQVI